MSDKIIDHAAADADEPQIQTDQPSSTYVQIDDQMHRLVRRLGELIGTSLAADAPVGSDQTDIAR